MFTLVSANPARSNYKLALYFSGNLQTSFVWETGGDLLIDGPCDVLHVHRATNIDEFMM